MIIDNSAYGMSKVGVTVMTKIFARRADKEGKGVFVFSCHPGYVSIIFHSCIVLEFFTYLNHIQNIQYFILFLFLFR